MRVAVVLFNLGGPDSLASVEPFLRNLFSDPAVIGLPTPFRQIAAALAAKRRAPVAREIYAKLGGASPIVAETIKQGEALDAVLISRGLDARSFVAMRCWHPFIAEAMLHAGAWSPDRIVLLPLYPQYSMTTAGSSLAEWDRLAGKLLPGVSECRICCFPQQRGFIDALAQLIQKTLTRRKSGVDYRLLLSAHGLPERTIATGDPYRWQVGATAKALVEELGVIGLDWKLTFQSRVGPLKWIGPATDAEIVCAGREGRGVIVAPIAFVSEHSETLVELDLEYAKLAKENAVPDYLRVPTVGTHPAFIGGLADLVVDALEGRRANRCCPDSISRCYRKN